MPRLFAYAHLLDLVTPGETGAERCRLQGHRLRFAARSTRDWGTRDNPAPMLALVSGGGSCRGVAVELEPAELEARLAEWRAVEGADILGEAHAEVGLPFRRDEVTVTLLATDPSGPHALRLLPPERLARMAVVARGRRGTGVEYLELVRRALGQWGLQEPEFDALWKEVEKERGEGWR